MDMKDLWWAMPLAAIIGVVVPIVMLHFGWH